MNLTFDFLQRISTRGYVRLAMSLEFGISIQKWPDIQKKVWIFWHCNPNGWSASEVVFSMSTKSVKSRRNKKNLSSGILPDLLFSFLEPNHARTEHSQKLKP